MASETATNSVYSLLPQRLIPLENDVSPFSGSLAVLLDDRGECCGYAVACGSKVTVVRVSGKGEHTIIEPFSTAGDDKNKAVDGLTLVTGVKWCYLSSGETLLVVTSFAGFAVFNTNGTQKLFQYRMTHNDRSTVASCVKGIASVSNSLCIGTSEGHILVFSVSSVEGVEYNQQLEAHRVPVTCLCGSSGSYEGRVVSGDESGQLLVWENPSKNSNQIVLYGVGLSGNFPCVSVCWYNYLVISCFGNGTMRIFDAKVENFLIEVSAHGRLISGLDIAIDSGHVLTVSEDSTVSVWQLDTSGKSPKLSLIHNRLIENSMLTGGVMCDSVGSMFAVVRYGYNTILEYGKS